MPAIDFHSITVSGTDSSDFLQGQLTCDIHKVTQKPSLGAYCNAKGRMLANFWIVKISDGYQLLLPHAMLDVVEATLKKYGAFSKVNISQQALTEHFNLNFDRLYYIKQKIAFIFAQTSLLFLPQMIGWEQLGGVSFEKGCYLGQEVVARTQHLGKLKRHLHAFALTQSTQAQPGDKLINEDNDTVGIVCDAVFDHDVLYGLAVIEDRFAAQQRKQNDIANRWTIGK